MAVRPASLRAPFAAFPEVVQHRIARQGSGLGGQVVLRTGSPPGSAERLRAALERELREAGAVPPPITVTAVPGIERDAGPAAKFQQIGRPSRAGARPDRRAPPGPGSAVSTGWCGIMELAAVQRQAAPGAEERTMNLRRVLHAVLGGVVLVVGAALLVLPGPGLLLVFAGLVLLSRAFPRLERFVEPVKARAMQAAEISVRSRWRLAGSGLVGLTLIGAGVVWGLRPDLPIGGWATGSSLILSGLVLLGLLGYSRRQVRARQESAPVREQGR